MESRTNYAIVGAFVLLLSAGIIVFAVWLGKYGFAEEYSLYKVYTKESVSGLSINATVKYRGVDVGSVESIKINPNNIEEVEVLLRVKKGTPVTKGMSAQLKYFGLTGLAYIELSGGRKNAPLLKETDGKIPILKSKPSLYDRIDTTLSSISKKLSVSLDRINKLLSDKNIKNISLTIKNTKDITANINRSKADITAAIKNFVKIEKNIQTLTRSLSETSSKISSSSDAFKNMSISIKKIAQKNIKKLTSQIIKTSKEANSLITDIIKSIKNGDYNLKSITSSTLFKINQATRELRLLLINGNKTIEEIKNSPSNLLFKKQKPVLGPGEKLQ